MSDTPDVDTEGMDPRLVRFLREQCGPHCYGDQNADGIDLSLIRANLKLSPTERIRQADRATTDSLRLRRVGQNA